MAQHKKHNTHLPGLFTQPEMPEQYYAGDAPNPLLGKYAREWSSECSDSYSVEPLGTALTASKATALYDLHSYHQGKKAHAPIVTYIRHYTDPGALVLDPFAGSGSTSLAAALAGRSALTVDRSPAATFIASNYVAPCNSSKLNAAFDRVLDATRKEIGWVYEAKGPHGENGTISFMLWSQQFECHRCLQATTLFDAPDADVVLKSGKVSRKKVCPHCLKDNKHESLESEPVRKGFVPVATSYECSVRPKRRFRSASCGDRSEEKAFREFDLKLVEKVQQSVIPYWYPQQRMLNSEDEQWGFLWRPYHSGISCVSDFFTHRNNLVLSTFRHYAIQLGDEYASRLLFLMTSILWHASRMSQFKEGGGGIMPGLYYVPPTHKEQNVLTLLERKFKDFVKAYDELDPESSRVCVSTQSATDLSAIPSECIDYIFTDPPYAENVQYGEANFLWEAWLGFDTDWRQQEVIINPHLGRTEAFWKEMMAKAMRECFRVLKPGRWLTLCYHDSSEGTWELVQDIMAEAGFVVAPSDKAVFIETLQKSPKQTTTAKATKRDLVLNFRKPAKSEAVASHLYIPAGTDAKTFGDIARQIIREFLVEHPGSSKDRIYDVLVTRMVSRGEMEAHNFDSLLGSVAEEVREEVTTTNDEGEWGRWYIKETADQIDVAEQAKEDAAAQRIEEFMKEMLSEHPEAEGVHYSELFEQIIVIPVEKRPRRLFENWLPEYFFKTPEGTWRPPADEVERQQKAAIREAGTLRRMKRFANALLEGVPVRDQDRPDSARTLAEWIRQCRRAGLYEQGRVMYEKGGLDLDRLNEDEQIEVEDDYRICVKRGSEEEAPKKPKSRKKTS